MSFKRGCEEVVGIVIAFLGFDGGGKGTGAFGTSDGCYGELARGKEGFKDGEPAWPEAPTMAMYLIEDILFEDRGIGVGECV